MRFIRIMIIILLALILIGAGVYFFAPKMVVKVIMNENSGLGIIPEGVKQEINEKVDDGPAVLDSLKKNGVHITIDDIIREIDNASVEEISMTLEKLQQVELRDKDHAVRIVLENMDLGVLENEKVVTAVKQRVKMSQIKKALKMARDNGKPYALTIPMAKETVKGLLLEKKKEVESALNE